MNDKLKKQVIYLIILERNGNDKIEYLITFLFAVIFRMYWKIKLHQYHHKQSVQSSELIVLRIDFIYVNMYLETILEPLKLPAILNNSFVSF